MGSVGNSNPWFPYQSNRDCSQGFCSIYCPQWCYIIFPPPPPFAAGGSSNSSPFDFSPLIVALIGILASAFIIIGYFTIISKYFRRTTGNHVNEAADSDDQISSESYQASSSSGLDEALIKSITVWKYKKNDGCVEETDHCSVCLSEFQENESLRILPKCSHLFHLPCIDTWLMSNSSCPLCRSTILPTNILPISAQQTQPSSLNLSALDSQFRRNSHTVLVVQNFQEAVVVEAGSDGSPNDAKGRVSAERQSSEQRESVIEIREDEFQFQPFRRCVSMTSCSYPTHASADNILRATYNGERVEEEEGEQEQENVQTGIGSSRGIEKEDRRFNNKRGDLNLAMKRSISAGRIPFTKE